MPPVVTPAAALSIADIETVANQLGVSPTTALAAAYVESGFDPTAAGDPVNGVPSSFGLYQLHQGGELGSLTPAQASDPTTNARVALSQFAQVEKAHPNATPGAIALFAQRPSEWKPGMSDFQAASTSYAAEVTVLAQDLQSKFGSSPTPAQVASDLGNLGALKGDVARANTPSGAGAVTPGVGPLTGTNGLLSGLNPFSGWAKDAMQVGVYLLAAVAGGTLLVLGIKSAVPSSGQGPKHIPIPVPI